MLIKIYQSVFIIIKYICLIIIHKCCMLLSLLFICKEYSFIIKIFFKSINFTGSNSVPFKKCFCWQNIFWNKKKNEWMHMHVCASVLHTHKHNFVAFGLYDVVFLITTLESKVCIASDSIGLIFKGPLSLLESYQVKKKKVAKNFFLND